MEVFGIVCGIYYGLVDFEEFLVFVWFGGIGECVGFDVDCGDFEWCVFVFVDCVDGLIDVVVFVVVGDWFGLVCYWWIVIVVEVFGVVNGGVVH